MSDPLLSIEGLRTHIHADGRTIRAVDGVDLTVEAGETVCLVGETGSGKTVTCESITRLLPTPPAELVDGRIRFDGQDLATAPESHLRSVRGRRIGHVFQNPADALDPVYTVGEQLVEAVEATTDRRGEGARARAIRLLDRVGIPDPAARMDDYPHELSGGMIQRAVIALALSGDPDLLVADEPTTALDVTIEAGILELFADLQAERDMGVLFVTHDLGVVAEVADRVVVLYGGRVMERGGVVDVFESPAHPYTQGLLASLPGRDGGADPIGGDPVDPADPPDGCRFAPRCPHAIEACRSGEHPPLYSLWGPDREAACVFHDGRRDPATVLDSAPGAAGEGPSGDDAATGGADDGPATDGGTDHDPSNGGDAGEGQP